MKQDRGTDALSRQVILLVLCAGGMLLVLIGAYAFDHPTVRAALVGVSAGAVVLLGGLWVILFKVGKRHWYPRIGALIGIVAAFVLWLLIYRSRWGYEIRLIGDNPNAARYAGVNISRNTILVMMVSGALAGLGGMSEITGVVHRLQTSPIAAGYGFTGIIVAWLSKLHPVVIIVVSVLFGALLLAGREIQPSGVPKMIQGIILVCLIASDFLLRYRLRIIRAGAEE